MMASSCKIRSVKGVYKVESKPTHMLVHGLWQVGDVEVRVMIICDSLELGVERLL